MRLVQWTLVVLLLIGAYLMPAPASRLLLLVGLAYAALLLFQEGIAALARWVAQRWRTRKLSAQERRIRERDANTESPLERSLAAALDDAGISYEREYRISRISVDFAFPASKLIVECDGWRYHHDRAQQDARRDAFLKRRGWKVLRLSGDRIRSDISGCVKAIADEL